MNSIKSIELLAPASDPETGIAAINHGADAVYIGGPRFGARYSASNSFRDIEKLCKYAAKFNAKVYPVINTILFNNEIRQAEQDIKRLWNAGADAIIIQDMSILMMDLPPIKIFASTQNDNWSHNKIRALELAGVKRVILPREMTLKEIKDMSSITDLDLEFFVHGAVCVSISGRCYLSQALFGRSANRGRCSQPCRMLYSLVNREGKTLIKEKYLLSPKDLNLSDHLESLIDSGISSFKIEGRLKSAEYIKNTCASYRKEIDKILSKRTDLKKSSEGVFRYQFTPDTAKTFNRGFTDYFINGKEGENCSFVSPKFMGEYIGSVNERNSRFFTICNIKTNNLKPGDGICFTDKKNILQGKKIYKIFKNQIFPDSMNQITKGLKIYRNYDKDFIQKLKKPDSGTRKIPVHLELREERDSVTCIANTYGTDTETVCSFEKPEERSRSENFTTFLKNQLMKSGDTDFEITTLKINLKNNWFFKSSEINEIRRTTLNKLMNKIISREKSVVDRTQKFFRYLDKAGQEFNISNDLSEKYYKELGAEHIEKCFELNPLQNTPLMYTRFCIRKENGLCMRNRADNTPLWLKTEKFTLRVEFRCTECRTEIFLEP